MHGAEPFDLLAQEIESCLFVSDAPAEAAEGQPRDWNADLSP